MTFAQLNARRIRNEQNIVKLRDLALAADETYTNTIKAVERIYGSNGVAAVVAEAAAISEGTR